MNTKERNKLALQSFLERNENKEKEIVKKNSPVSIFKTG
jgi:hypothetical protein